MVSSGFPVFQKFHIARTYFTYLPQKKAYHYLQVRKFNDTHMPVILSCTDVVLNLSGVRYSSLEELIITHKSRG